MVTISAPATLSNGSAQDLTDGIVAACRLTAETADLIGAEIGVEVGAVQIAHAAAAIDEATGEGAGKTVGRVIVLPDRRGILNRAAV